MNRETSCAGNPPTTHRAMYGTNLIAVVWSAQQCTCVDTCLLFGHEGTFASDTEECRWWELRRLHHSIIVHGVPFASIKCNIIPAAGIHWQPPLSKVMLDHIFLLQVGSTERTRVLLLLLHAIVVNVCGECFAFRQRNCCWEIRIASALIRHLSLETYVMLRM